MPLVLETLRSGLFAVMNAYPPTVLEAANGLAGAYSAYAQGGQFLLGVMPSLAAQQVGLAQSLFAVMNAYGDAAAYANAWATGLTAFWTAVPIAGVNSGATIGCPGASAAGAAILASLSAMPETTLEAASALASALATATATVTATVTLPGPPFTTITPIV